MTRDDLLKRLRELNVPGGDVEIMHSLADDALVEFIDDSEVAEAYAAIPKWYA